MVSTSEKEVTQLLSQGNILLKLTFKKLKFKTLSLMARIEIPKKI